MSRYYDDTVRLMGALQIIPKFMQHFVHSIITNKGHALNTLFERLHRAVDVEHADWEEKETLKSNLHFVFLELCARPEYTTMIREEIQSIDKFDLEGLNRLPILDSFIKEAVRANPLDKMGIRRKALRPYTFSDGGPDVLVGEIACVSSWEIMHNDAIYPKPEAFDGLRFVANTHSKVSAPSENVMRGTTFTDASKDFPIWGLGSKVWYVKKPHCSGPR
ncbi:MAG: hypothetical protein Q9184_001480 [Pyrenodesmia sp. 2 TL-2023]